MKNAHLIQYKKITDGRGDLTALEGGAGADIPFDVKRIYYIYNVGEGVERGYHAHVDLQQVLVCVNGSVKIRLKTPFETQVVTLDDPATGLYVGNMFWREMFDFSPNAVLLVMASKHYKEKDYIRNYEEYERVARPYYMEEK